MNAEQAWQTVLAQLQMDMPRASFDTWVRDTRPVAYEKGTLRLGVRNGYARDWLDSRLAASVNKILIVPEGEWDAALGAAVLPHKAPTHAASFASIRRRIHSGQFK